MVFLYILYKIDKKKLISYNTEILTYPAKEGNIMIHILKGGCGTRHPSSYRMSRPEGVPNYVLLIVKTPGEFMINNNFYLVSPGNAIILAPFTSSFYGNPKGDYIDDWLHFELADDSIFDRNEIPKNIPFSIGNAEIFTFFIRQILWEKSYTPPQFMSKNIEALFSVLINHLSVACHNINNQKSNHRFENELQQLRLELQNSIAEKHTIEEYAKKLGVSPSYFQHLYTSFFNISFQKDLIQMRIEHAKYILTTTDLTLEQIAEICGYSNEVHFYRQFKQITGLTPSKYRKKESTY